MQTDSETEGVGVFIIQPNYETLGHMRLWAWDFVCWAGREMGLVADVYWWCVNAIPTAATQRTRGLPRQSVKWCVWFGPLGLLPRSGSRFVGAFRRHECRSMVGSLPAKLTERASRSQRKARGNGFRAWRCNAA